MEVFISWSGESSRKVAEALHDWLPNVIQSLRPFMSAEDIKEGSRWAADIANHLQEARFGLLCLTPDNLEAPWIHFEAGALSKTLESTWVVPYLFNISVTQLQGPLTQFQAATADRDSTKRMVAALNSALQDQRLDESRLEDAFENWWPKLEASLNQISTSSMGPLPSRTQQEILEEILDLLRHVSRQSSEVVPEIRAAAESLSFEFLQSRNRGIHRRPMPDDIEEKIRLAGGARSYLPPWDRKPPPGPVRKGFPPEDRHHRS